MSWSTGRSRCRVRGANFSPIRRCAPPISKGVTGEADQDTGRAMTVSLVVLTIIMFGGGGFLMGQALAETWRPWWQVVPYGALLALGNNFLGFALFDGAFFIDSLFSKGARPLSEAILEYVVDFGV